MKTEIKLRENYNLFASIVSGLGHGWIRETYFHDEDIPQFYDLLNKLASLEADQLIEVLEIVSRYIKATREKDRADWDLFQFFSNNKLDEPNK